MIVLVTPGRTDRLPAFTRLFTCRQISCSSQSGYDWELDKSREAGQTRSSRHLRLISPPEMEGSHETASSRRARAAGAMDGAGRADDSSRTGARATPPAEHC